MPLKYFRWIGLLTILNIAGLFFFIESKSFRWVSGLCFGSAILTLNVFLSVFIFSKVKRPSNQRILHRLALLLAISIKGVNLLFLAYLGIELLDLGAYPIVLGAMCNLVIHVAVFFLFSDSILENKKRTPTES